MYLVVIFLRFTPNKLANNFLLFVLFLHYYYFEYIAVWNIEAVEEMEVKIDKFPSHVVFFLNQFPRQGLEQNFLFLVSFIVIYSSLSYICCEKV